MTELICNSRTNGVSEGEDETSHVREIFKKITQGSSHDKVLEKVCS